MLESRPAPDALALAALMHALACALRACTRQGGMGPHMIRNIRMMAYCIYVQLCTQAYSITAIIRQDCEPASVE